MKHRGRILIVDDEPAMRRSISRLLHPFGQTVFEAQDGEEALERVVAHRPDLVVLDITLSQMSGFEVCRRIRVLPEAVQVYILFLSARNTITDLAQGLRYGGNDYLTKPFDPDQLLARIDLGLGIVQKAKEATRDPLTGLYNAHYFLQRYEEEKARAQRHNLEMAALLVECTQRERLEPLELDLIQLEIVRELRPLIRRTDFAAQLVSGLLVLLMPETDLESAKQVQRRLEEGLVAALGGKSRGLALGLGFGTGETAEPLAEAMATLRVPDPNRSASEQLD